MAAPEIRFEDAVLLRLVEAGVRNVEYLDAFFVDTMPLAGSIDFSTGF